MAYVGLNVEPPTELGFPLDGCGSGARLPVAASFRTRALRLPLTNPSCLKTDVGVAVFGLPGGVSRPGRDLRMNGNKAVKALKNWYP